MSNQYKENVGFPEVLTPQNSALLLIAGNSDATCLAVPALDVVKENYEVHAV